jgi:hypothetical protein
MPTSPDVKLGWNFSIKVPGLPVIPPVGPGDVETVCDNRNKLDIPMQYVELRGSSENGRCNKIAKCGRMEEGEVGMGRHGDTETGRHGDVERCLLAPWLCRGAVVFPGSARY